MPDPTLTTTNCHGATCSATMGVDEGSLDPNLLLVVVNKDERTIDCTDGVGVHVKICAESAEVPYAERSTDDSGNALRVQESDDPEVDCGLVVLPPLMQVLANGTRETIPQNVDPDGPDAPLEPGVLVLGPIGKSIVLANNDTVARLYTITAKASCIVEVGVTDDTAAEMQVAVRTEATVIGLLGSGAVAERVVTLQYPTGQEPTDPHPDGRTVNDGRDIVDMVLLQPGETTTLNYRARTLRSQNMIGAGTNRGLVIYDIIKRTEQVRTS